MLSNIKLFHVTEHPLYYVVNSVSEIFTRLDSLELLQNKSTIYKTITVFSEAQQTFTFILKMQKFRYAGKKIL